MKFHEMKIIKNEKLKDEINKSNYKYYVEENPYLSDFEYDQVPTTAHLTSKAQQYANNNSIEVPQVNLTISFVPLYQTEEYKNIAPLERVSLGDTVHVYFDKLGVEASSRVVKTVWNANLDRYDSVELGSTKANLNTVINQTIDSAVTEAIGDIDMGAIESELVDMSKLVINGLGLYFTKQELGTGGYRYILHNAPQLADSDTQYYMSAGGIMVSNDYGQTWVTGYDPQTGTLATQALSTIILRALEIYGSFLRFGSEDSNYIDVAPYSNSSNVPQGVSFDGTGTIRMQPQGAFYVNNLKTTGSNPTYYNRMWMDKNGADSSNIVALINYDDTKDLITNLIYLQAHRVTTNSSNIKTTTNRIYMENDSTINGNRYLANSFQMASQTYNSDVNTETTGNYIYLYNYSQRSASDTNTYLANYLNMSGGGTSPSLEIRNYKYKKGLQSNKLRFENSTATPSGNVVYNASKFENFNTSADTVGNRVTLLANQSLSVALDGKTYETATNNIFIDNKLYGTENTGNSIWFSASTSQQNLIISNGRVNISSSAYINGNEINMLTTNSQNTLSLENRSSTGATINYIRMNILDEDTGTSNRQTYIYARSDLKLYSGGAVRLKANYQDATSNQDIWLEGTSLHLTYSNNFRVHKGSTTYTLKFDASGYVMWT